MPANPLSERVRDEWLQRASLKGLQYTRVSSLDQLVNGKTRRVSMQGAVYRVNNKLTAIKFTDKDWFSIGNNVLNYIEVFVFICNDAQTFYAIPKSGMQRLATDTPSNSYDGRKEFHIYPKSAKYPDHTYYAPGKIDSVKIFYANWSVFSDARSSLAPMKTDDILSEPAIQTLKEISEDLSIPPSSREKALKQYEMAIRDARFRVRILEIYSNKCAICGIQLGLVQAAHIVPVHKDGTDELNNGVALCYLHHKAFDNGTIGIDEDYKIFVSGNAESEFRAAHLDGGFQEFIKTSRMGQKIYLPKDPKYHPHATYLRQRITG